MASASQHFFNSSNSDNTLFGRIVPSDKQYQYQQEKWNELAEYLKQELAKKVSFKIDTWLQGSYKFATQIRPMNARESFDIDLGLYFAGDDINRVSFNSLRTLVQETLIDYAANNPSVVEVKPIKDRCCRIVFVNNFHIDIPVYFLCNSTGVVKLAAKNGWENSDPKKFYSWFLEKFGEERTEIRRLIRYFKAWSNLRIANKKSRPSSILITVLVSEAFLDIKDAYQLTDDQMFRDIVASIFDRLSNNSIVLNPVDRAEDLNRLESDQFRAFLLKLKKLIEKSDRALKEKDYLRSCIYWQDVFLQFFPLPDPDSISDEDAIFVNPIVRVNAQSKDNSSHKPYTGTNTIGPIPKNCTIYFSLDNVEDLPAGSTVSWMVRNFGDEAANVNDFGHLAGTGVFAQENSAYNGIHYMDCVVRNRDQIIGIRSVKVHVAKQKMPDRNPKSRPSYTKLR